jgi:hypothetical protein
MNLSQSGIGVSVGVPGFRVGSGPRGSYVRLGAKGIFYQASLPAANRRPLTVDRPAERSTDNDIVMLEVPSASISRLAEANPTELLQQIQAAARHRSSWPWVVVATAILALFLAGVAIAAFAQLIIGFAAAAWVRQADLAKSRAVIFYDVVDKPADKFQSLLSAFDEAASSQRAWRIVSQGDVRPGYQRKVNAGATRLNDREPLRRHLNGPPALATNIAVPSFEGKSQGMYLLPDRVLVRTGRNYADLSYRHLSVNIEAVVFIEDGSVPSDSQLVGHTWRFVNKSGGPDRRFKDNRQLPKLLYGQLEMTSSEGMRQVWQFSKAQVVEALAQQLDEYRR